MVQKTIGKRIAELRGKETQEQLAKKLHITREKLSMWEQDRRGLKAEDIIQLSKHFGVSSHFILFGVEHEYAKVNEELGLTQAAIDTLRKFKSDDALYGPNGAIYPQGRCEALSKAISSYEFISMVSLLMKLEKGEPGFYIDSVYSSGDKYYQCRLSPDAYVATLTSLLNLIIQSIRKGESDVIPQYGPWLEEMMRMQKERGNAKKGRGDSNVEETSKQ